MRATKTILALLSFLVMFLAAASVLAEEPFPVISTEELKKLIDGNAEAITVIDARNPEEYQEVHIKGAINIPEKQFVEQAQLLPADKSRPLVIYCNGVKCGKSKKAAQKAKEMGYANITLYAEGMPVWEEKGMPIYAGPDYEKKVETTRIAPMDLQTMMQAKPGEITVVDVRDPEEFLEGHIPGSINIPVAGFASGSEQLDKKKTIVVACNSGGRSYNAYRKLMKLGYEKIGQAIFQDWKDQGMPVDAAGK